MGKSPDKCPVCQSSNWVKIDTQKKGFSTGKAVAGVLLTGGIGVIFGGLGKKKSTYVCQDCRFQHEYKGN